MSTPLTDSINALTTYANSITGASDTTLSDAVYTLAQGYGQGGASNIESGSFTVSEDTTTASYSIPHSLGVVPDFVIVMADAFEVTTDLSQYYGVLSFASKKNVFTTTGFGAYNTTWAKKTTPWAAYEYIAYTKFLFADSFKVPYSDSSDTLKAGVTYHYVVGTYS